MTLESRDGAGEARVESLAGTLTETPLDGEERIARAMKALSKRAGRPLPAATIRAESTIPVARGLGSSGAATVAGLVLANALLGDPLDRDALFDLGCALEGHPDNIGPALFGGCVVAMPAPTGRVSWFAARLHPELRLAVAVPRTRLETARARGALPTSVGFAVARDQARKLAQLLRGLEDLDPARLSLGTADELHTPHRLPLIPGGADAMAAALGAGALAAAISGSGSAIVGIGRGDLAPAANAMKKAFAKAGETAEAFVSAVPTEGYHITA